MSDLLAATRRFVDDVVLPHVAEWDRADALPDEAVDGLLGLGLTGALVPREHGGPGLTVSELVPVWRALSQGWISLTGAVNPSGLATTLLVRHGSDEQRARWLPQLGSGRVLASFSITEPQAGSDLSRLEATAARRPGGGLTLDGEKRWVAGGATADVVFLMAAVDDAEKPSCVIVPAADGRGTATWRVSELDKVGYRGVESAAYVFDRHQAPGAEVLGGEEGIGRGARQMLDALDVGRVNVACRALGIIDRALHAAVGESVERKIGDGPRMIASRSRLAGRPHPCQAARRRDAGAAARRRVARGARGRRGRRA